MTTEYTIFVEGSTNAHNTFPGVLTTVVAKSRKAAVAAALELIEAHELPEIYNGQFLSAVPPSALTSEQFEQIEYWQECGCR